MKSVDPNSRLERVYRETLVGLDAIRRVGEILGDTFDEDVICQRAVQIFVKELPFENCSILLLDRSRHSLRLRAAAGKSDSTLAASQRDALNRDLMIRVGEGVAGDVVTSGKPAVITDTGRYPQFKPIPSAVPIRSLLCMPVFSRDEVIGVMNLSHPEIEEISSEQEKTLEVLSHLVGQAITISRLSAELLGRSERLAALGQMAASVAHEVNNPLTNILLRAQRIQQSTGLSESDATMAHDIEEQAEKIGRIVGRLLEFSRQRRGSTRTANVNQTLLKALELTAPYLSRKKGIQLERALSPDLPAVLVDASELEQVVTNLLMNAIESIPETGEIVVSSGPVAEGVEFRIQDSGVGMSEEARSRIFEPFFTTRHQEGGTGLGLVVCKQIIEGAGGKILVESEFGRGSSFTVVLPAANREKNSGSSAERARKP